MNLDKKIEFVYYDEELRLITPTTDAGQIFYLKLIK